MNRAFGFKVLQNRTENSPHLPVIGPRIRVSAGPKKIFFWMVGSLLLVSSPIRALTSAQDSLENPVQALRWQPAETISLGNLNQSQGFNLTSPLNALGQNLSRETEGFARHLKRSFQIGFPKAVQSYFRELGVHPAIQIKTTDENPEASFQLQGQPSQTQGQSYDHRFLINSVPICDVHARSHKLSDGSGLLMGEIPRIKDLDLSLSADDWPQLDLTKQYFEAFMLLDSEDSIADDNNVALPKRWLRADRCYLIRNQKPLAVWNLTVRINGALYSALADTSEVYRLQPQFFTVEGKATTWAHNRSTEPQTERPLYGLKGDGTLSSDLLRTIVPPEIPKAQEPSHIFNYPPSDRRIEEVTAYANAQDHLRWFQSLGFSWYGVKPLEIRIHYKPQNKANNALFEPGDEATNTPPTITIDDGDGVELQNLVTDGDVVSHELGHHILFKTLKTVTGESLVLHEGLSDFFVFSRTGDPCLGETICPADSGQCQQKGKCLRSAANRLVYKDEVWNGFAAGRSNQLGHLHGQLISGMMWDMRSSNQFAGNELSTLTLKAASFFAETSNFCQYLRALYAADQELYAGKHMELIKFVAQGRGLGEFVDPGKECPAGTLKRPEQNISSSPDKKSKTKVKCGSIAPNSHLSKGKIQGNMLSMLLLMTFPMLLFLVRNQRERNKIRNRATISQTGGTRIQSHRSKHRKSSLLTIILTVVSLSSYEVSEATTYDHPPKSMMKQGVLPQNISSTPPEKKPASDAPRSPFTNSAVVKDSLLTLSLILQWEGRAIKPENIAAVENLRKAFPLVDVVHLISPAYFTRSDGETKEALNAMEKIVRPKDYYGVLLGSWKSVVTQAGVIFRASPTFWGTTLTQGQCETLDCGVDIPLHLYPQQDIEKIIKYSMETLEKKALGRPKSYGVTGWVSSPAVVDTASRLGLIYDFSPVTPEALQATMNYYPLSGWVKGLWEHINSDSQPIFRNTSQGRMLLFPQVLGAVDHQAHNTLPDTVSRSTQKWQETKTSQELRKINLPIVMYLETAEDTAPRIERELTEALKIAEKNKVKILKQTFANISVPTSPSHLSLKTQKEDRTLSEVGEAHKNPAAESAAH